MDLEKINNEYLKLKKDLEAAKSEVKNLENQKETIKNNITILEAEKSNAKIAGDTALVQKKETEIQTAKKYLENVLKEIEEKTKKWEGIKEKIDDKIKQLMENPEMKKHLDEVLAKKYSRKIEKQKKERDALKDKALKFTKLNELAEKHPSVKKNLIGMANARKQEAALIEELKTADDAKKTEINDVLIPQLITKYFTNKDLLADYLEKQNIKFEDSDFMQLANRFAENKGNINIKGTIDKEVKALEKQIRSLDKQIENHTNALNAIDKDAVQRAGVQQPQSNVADAQSKKGFFSRLADKFRAWKNKRNQKSLPTAEPVDATNSTTQNNNKKDKKGKNEFSKSLKYEIVQEQLAKMEKDGIKAGKQQRKQDKADKER